MLSQSTYGITCGSFPKLKGRLMSCILNNRFYKSNQMELKDFQHPIGISTTEGPLVRPQFQAQTPEKAAAPFFCALPI